MYIVKIGDYYVSAVIVGLVSMKSSARHFATKTEAGDFLRRFFHRKRNEYEIIKVEE